MNEIKCRAKHDWDNDGGLRGCSWCGGYEVLLKEVTLACGHKVWDRPGQRTIYNGKTAHMFDGQEVVYTLCGDQGGLNIKTTVTCIDCDITQPRSRVEREGEV